VSERQAKNLQGYARAGSRAAVYTSAVGVILFQDWHFGLNDGYSLAFFLLFSLIFELMFLVTGDVPRRFFYVVCLLGLGISGLFLIREAAHVQAVSAGMTNFRP
jgi:hypothetical protein